VEEFQKLKSNLTFAAAILAARCTRQAWKNLGLLGSRRYRAFFVRSLRDPAFGARKLLAVFPRLTPIGF